MVTDNECARGIANETVKQKRSKAIDMRFYWIRDRVAQKQFKICWQKGSDNLADYYTKHHPPAHHQRMRSRYLQQDESANAATSEMVTFAKQTKFRQQSTLPKHEGNQAPQRTATHNNRMKESLQRRDEYTRNNQPWIEVVNGSRKQRHHGGAVEGNRRRKRNTVQVQATTNNKTPSTSTSTQQKPQYNDVHCEGVLNNSHSHPIETSVPSVPHSKTPFPRAQASNDTSPCLQARLIGRPSTDRYWPKRLVQRPIHIRQ
jgi:hypothetical protein